MVYEFCFDDASIDEITELLYGIANELCAQRNNCLSLIEKYACDANEGRLLTSDAYEFIEQQVRQASRYDKAADMMDDAIDVLNGRL